MSKKTIICVGYSRLPEGMAAKNLYGAMGVGLEIDANGFIVNTSATFVTDMCQSFFNESFVGHCLNDGIDECVKEFESRYYGMGKKAIVSAIYDAYNQYLTSKELNTNILI